MRTKVFLVTIVSATTVVDSFAFNLFAPFQPIPGLAKKAEAQKGEKFSVRMDIGKEKDETHLFLDGLCIELLKEAAPSDNNVGLPGANGPHPKTSTGALALNVLATPSFIDMFGTQRVRFEKGCWEMVWKNEHVCGSIICGFHVPSGAKRNGAHLPSGRLYLTFPVWSQEGLAIKQAERLRAEAKVKDFTQEKDEELKKYAESSNLVMKALHYRNAFAAAEKINLTGIRFLVDVPGSADVIPIGDGLLMNTKGAVWNKDMNFFGEKHTLLGDAVLTPFVEDAAEVLKP